MFDEFGAAVGLSEVSQFDLAFVLGSGLLGLVYCTRRAVF